MLFYSNLILFILSKINPMNFLVFVSLDTTCFHTDLHLMDVDIFIFLLVNPLTNNTTFIGSPLHHS